VKELNKLKWAVTPKSQAVNLSGWGNSITAVEKVLCEP